MADALFGEVGSYEVNYFEVNGSEIFVYVPPIDIPPSGEIICVPPEARVFLVPDEARTILIPGRRTEPCQ